ncbi:hypothetical protein VTO73DRAFT_3528 [Trametes versicolor]
MILEQIKLATDIPDSVALSLAAKPKPVSSWGSRAKKAERKERNSPGKGAAVKKQSPTPKTIRMRAGRLAALKDMPMDIFLEIVKKLDPLALLRLAQSSKYFRSLLMTRSARHLWVASFRNVPGVPPCPPYISEPRYAAVLFDQYCFACGNARSTNVDHTACVRLCAPCFKTNFSEGRQMYRGRELSPKRQKLLPTLCGSIVHYHPAFHDRSARIAQENFNMLTFYVPEWNAVVDQLSTMDARVELPSFVEERRAFVTLMQAHARSVLEWKSGCYVQKWAEEDAAVKDRKTAILERLGALGYTADDYPNNDAWKKILDRPTRLTERIWKTALPKLRALIDQKRVDDGQAAFEQRLEQRRAEFQPFYEDFLQNTLSDADREFAPNWHDACALPSVHGLLNENRATVIVTQARVTTIQSRLLLDVRASAQQTKRDLMEMLHRETHGSKGPLMFRGPREYSPMPQYDMAEIEAELAKATSLFTCHRCPIKSASAQVIVAHWRTEHPSLKWNDKWPIEQIFDRRRKFSEWPSQLPWVSAKPAGPSRTKTALETLGLPEDTSMAQMDSWVREGRLICRCGHPGLAAVAENGWGGLMHHVSKEIEWCHRISGWSRSRHYFGPDVANNHHLSGETPCLQLLAEGEQMMISEYAVPGDVVAEVTALLNANDVKPTCSTCYRMVKDGSHWNGLYLEKDVQVLAHHMNTKHDKALSKNSICFYRYRDDDY